MITKALFRWTAYNGRRTPFYGNRYMPIVEETDGAWSICIWKPPIFIPGKKCEWTEVDVQYIAKRDEVILPCKLQEGARVTAELKKIGV